MSGPKAPERSFSRFLLAASVPAEGLELTLRPNAGECAVLARDNDLVAIEELEARLHIARRGDERLEVTGSLRAKVRQTCVVTLEEFDARVEERVQITFAPPAPTDAGHRSRQRATDEFDEEAAFDEVGEDAPDPLIDGAIDLWAIVAEFLTLGLDLYPRSPGAAFVEPAPEAEKAGPFANLAARLKGKGG